MSTIPDIDSFWLLFGGALVFFMHVGFGMLQIGGVSEKSARQHLLKNVFDLSISAISWWLIGFGIAFGNDVNEFAGNSNVSYTQ
jgi:Amt family ammonium transporter